MPSVSTIDWFYNGSVKFENDSSTFKVFDTLEDAFLYFTNNLSLEDRVIGQLVTFALNTNMNWVIYSYRGIDCTDANYSNYKNWILINSAEINPDEDLELRVKYLEDTLIHYTDLIKQNGFFIVGSDKTDNINNTK